MNSKKKSFQPLTGPEYITKPDAGSTVSILPQLREEKFITTS